MARIQTKIVVDFTWPRNHSQEIQTSFESLWADFERGNGDHVWWDFEEFGDDYPALRDYLKSCPELEGKEFCLTWSW